MENDKFPIREQGYFCPGKEIKGLRLRDLKVATMNLDKTLSEV
jgi:hypothetical protein